MKAKGRKGIALACTTLALFTGFAHGQESRTGATKPQLTELGRENFSRVAASATEIKAVLSRDVGLLVELKRWLAKDATGNGQILNDSDLTDDSIFDRLETDIRFRATATVLLQKYGYLVPKLNPDSQAAKENELLTQERIKWLAQAQEQARAEAAQKRTASMKAATECEARNDC